MKEVQLIFNGGLGNQIFQYLASKIISEKFINLKVKYGLSEYILNGGRNFEINKILLEPLKISKGYKQYGEKVYNKILEKIVLLPQFEKDKIKFKLNLINRIYYEKKSSDIIKDSLEKLLYDLIILENKISKLKIQGFWQNPSSYIKRLEDYNKLFINTEKLLPLEFVPNNYISIHIRKGDYFLNKNSIDSYYSRFSPLYFIITALKLIPKDLINMPIYLISDDKNWRNKTVNILSCCTEQKIKYIKTKNHFVDWAILRHSAINICSNSTFSYTAALLNNVNKERKLRCIVPQWINKKESAYEKGWLEPEGFIDL